MMYIRRVQRGPRKNQPVETHRPVIIETELYFFLIDAQKKNVRVQQLSSMSYEVSVKYTHMELMQIIMLVSNYYIFPRVKF